MFNWIKRLFKWLRPRSRGAQKPDTKAAPYKPLIRATASWAANHVGVPFKEPGALLPVDYFWKQDEGAVNSLHWLAGAEHRAWRIYRSPVNPADYR